jgi:hypothetical protein
MKAAFGAILSAALEHTPAADRVVLDTGDGAALCFLGDPEDALFTANSLRSGVIESPEHGLRLRLGINLGPVRVVSDINGHSNVIGDGINVAQRVMSFAAPNQILVSRSYYEVVSRLAPDYANLFQYAGLHRDKHVREHEVYEVHLAPSTARVPPAPAEGASPREPAPRVAPVARFDAKVIERLATALAQEIGPVARVMVRRAAERAADERTLCEVVADHVPEERRAAFLAGLADLAPAPGASSGAPGSSAPAEAVDGPRPAGSARGVGPEVRSRAEQMLARHIGPLARILVRQAATEAASPRDLFERLSLHIEDPAARQAFLAEAERLT